jgi:hypothetical protein
MKFLKVSFLVFLFLIVCFSLYHIETKDNVSNNSYFLAITVIILFVLCFLLLALKIKVGGQYIQLEQDLVNLQVEQEKLSKLATTLFKLSILTKYLTIYPLEYDKNIEISNRLQDEIKQYINDPKIDDFEKELDESNKRFRGKE